MVISLIEIREKLKPQLKALLDVDNFKIVSAEHMEKNWIIVVEYQMPEKGPAGILVYYKTEIAGLKVSDEDGTIESMR
ncbi:MAG: hypothetical protein AMDU5_GPLC00004G0287 [Thermoplasmatales archaeon Gpl]|jgi:hypothetical protein|nr:MAG: hypothetical protein AMDU5_GPLC00004G0287 [Thermoplasmatales archaeon Gpl]